MALDVNLYEANGAALVVLTGRVVLDECDRLKAQIIPVIQPNVKQVNLDLSAVEFIDSAGLGALVGIKVTANKHRTRLALLNPSKEVSNILMVSKLDSIFDILTGTEAEEVAQALAKPENERPPTPGSAAQPRAAAMPTMPSAAAVPSTPGPATGESPGEQIDSLCRQAVEFMKGGNYDGAAQAYSKVLEINPNYVPALNNLAIVCEKRPEWHDQAVIHWKKVLEISERTNDQKHIDRANKHLKYLQGLRSS